MSISTRFDYNNHIAFIRTHAKIGTLYEKMPVTEQTEVNLLLQLFRTQRLIFASVYLQL